MSNEISVLRQVVSSDAFQGQLAASLPDTVKGHLNPERLGRMAISECIKNPYLLQCDRQSLLSSVMQIATLGLELDGMGTCYLVPLKNKVTPIVGAKGLITLAMQSGQVAAITSELIFENDFVDVEKGLNPRLVHKPAWKDKGALVGAYATARLTSGEVVFELMDLDEINAIKSRSPSGSKGKGPWITDFNEMARKCPLRRLCKRLPASVEKAAMIGDDGSYSPQAEPTSAQNPEHAQLAEPVEEAPQGIVQQPDQARLDQFAEANQ